jgi:hypothetical protein
MMFFFNVSSESAALIAYLCRPESRIGFADQDRVSRWFTA